MLGKIAPKLEQVIHIDHALLCHINSQPLMVAELLTKTLSLWYAPCMLIKSAGAKYLLKYVQDTSTDWPALERSTTTFYHPQLVSSTCNHQCLLIQPDFKLELVVQKHSGCMCSFHKRRFGEEPTLLQCSRGVINTPLPTIALLV